MRPFLIHHSLDMAMVQLLLREQTGPAPERVLAELTELFSRYVQKEPPRLGPHTTSRPK